MPSGYDKDDPPEIDGPDACPHCHLAPCITAKPPNWLRGSAEANLSNITKRFRLYRRFWTLLGQLGLWNHPQYIEYKQTKTSVLDCRDVMPDCVLRVSIGDLYYYSHLQYKVWSFQEVRGRFPNPPGVPYTDFEPSSRFLA